MPRITALEPQQRRGGRVSVYLDGEFVVGVDQEVAAALGLRVGQEIGAEQLDAVVSAEMRRRAKESALRLLGARARSRNELRRSLERKGYDSRVIEEVLDDLSRRQLLDDLQFARAWVESRTVARPMGRQRIVCELRGKGVASDLIEEALSGRLEDDTDLGLALTVGRQTVKRIRGEEPRAARRKLAAALQRRGFSWGVTSAVVDRLLPAQAGTEACFDDDA